MNNVQNYIANDNIMKILAEARNRVIWRGTVMPGVGYDSTAQGNKVYIYIYIYLYIFICNTTCMLRNGITQ